MAPQKYYSIGEVSKICHISKKTLRFYDQIGVMSPDKINVDNHYRFYAEKTLLSVPVIKYYKQMGFRLDEMAGFLDGNTYEACGKNFRRKIDELSGMQKKIETMYVSVKDWYNLILEAENVIENGVCGVAAKYIEETDYCYMDQSFDYNFIEAIINIEWTNYIESIGNAATGPVIILFPSFRDRMRGKCNQIRIMQKTILECSKSQTMKFGGYMAATCYHVGPHESLPAAYEKILGWANDHGYDCIGESYERYVTDYWTTRESDQFVTEVIARIAKQK
ncbi:MAG: MerR family transcriptional regulator [Clostridiales bacterium]|nr:MerR family transcriptional regulator [Clostridiales bacterium]